VSHGSGEICSVTGGLEPITGDNQFPRSPGCALSALRLGKVENGYGIIENPWRSSSSRASSSSYVGSFCVRFKVQT